MITATITDIQKTDEEVIVKVNFTDGDKINQDTTFTQALSDTIDQDIQDVINHICADLQPVVDTTPAIDVATQIGQVYSFDTTGVLTAEPVLAQIVGGKVK